MSNSYLDINSEYRNRNLWPIPGEFEIPISQTGLKEKGSALDPVSLAEPIAVWSCNAITTSQPTTFQVAGIITPQQGYGNVGYSQTGNRFTIVFEDPYNNSVQQEIDYFVGLVFWNVTANTFTRISTYRFIGNSQTTPTTYSIALITVSDIVTFSFGDEFIITDDSDLTRSNYPILFVPNGRNQNDAYLNYYLYCESNNDYRQITFYDSVYKYVSSKPWSSISDPTIQQYGNFCIRKEPPLFPLQSEQSQFVSNLSTSDNIIVNINVPCSLSILKDFYKFDFLRIRPYRNTDVDSRIFIGGGSRTTPTKTLIESFDGLTYKTSTTDPFTATIYTAARLGCLSVASNGTGILIAAGSNQPIPSNIITLSKSTDGGKNWTSISNPFVTTINSIDPISYYIIYVKLDVFYKTPIWVAVGQNAGYNALGITTACNCIYSTDLTTWTSSQGAFNFFNTPLYGITYFSSYYIACGLSVAIDNGIAYTKDIKSLDPWTLINLPPNSNNFIGYKIQNNGQTAIVVGRSDKECIWNIYYDPAGSGSFNAVASTDNPFIGGQCNSIAWNGSYWVAVGTTTAVNTIGKSTTVIASSSDGLIWKESTDNPFSGINSTITDINWTGTFWIATGRGTNFGVGTAQSYDANTWTPILSTNSSSDLPNLLDTYNSVSVINSYYTNLSGIYSTNIKSESRQIINYTNIDGIIANFKVYPPYDINTFNEGQFTIEVEQFSYDNAYPFVYIGTLIQQACCYEFELNQLILPNYTLSSGNGSKIAFYPFVYVELYTVPSSIANNAIYSNNPHATRILFKVPIYDVQDPDTTPYVRLVDCNMILTIKYNPNESLYFKVLLPNGDIFNTILPEYYSPEVPNPNTQISALFRYKRVI